MICFSPIWHSEEIDQQKLQVAIVEWQLNLNDWIELDVRKQTKNTVPLCFGLQLFLWEFCIPLSEKLAEDYANSLLACWWYQLNHELGQTDRDLVDVASNCQATALSPCSQYIVGL